MWICGVLNPRLESYGANAAMNGRSSTDMQIQLTGRLR
jgi:hypothetical protein